MASPRCRCVLDTNQVVGAGSRWIRSGVPERPNPHLRLLLLILKQHVGLYREDIVREYARVLILRGSPPERAATLIARIKRAFVLVPTTTSRAPVPPGDPDDEKFLLCALDGDADYLVSEDSDLLDLHADYARPAIVSCVQALAVL